jgi:hypothetical protein
LRRDQRRAAPGVPASRSPRAAARLTAAPCPPFSAAPPCPPSRRRTTAAPPVA